MPHGSVSLSAELFELTGGCSRGNGFAKGVVDSDQFKESDATPSASLVARRASGCPACNQTGTRGRVGFFELIGIHNTLREAIASGTSTSELKKLSAERYRSMRQDGIQKVADGVTTIDEVLRATQDVEDEI